MRRTIADLGGTMPEELPTPAESIKQVEQREQREQRRLEQEAQHRIQPPLFGEGEADQNS